MTDKRRSQPMLFLGVGLELAGVVGVLVAIGWWLDQRYGTSPILTLVGAGIGIVGGLTKLVLQSSRTMRQFRRSHDQDQDKTQDSKPPQDKP